MALNETVVEVVRFQAQGLTEIQARTKAMGAAIAESATKAETLARLLADRRYEQFARRVEGARKQYELLALGARNAAAAQALADGSAAKHLASVTRLNREYAELQRRTELVAKYGERWGTVAAKYGGALRAAGGAAAAAGAGAIGLARSGFSGTVEQNKLDLELKMLARELAGAFKPFIELLTKGARALREFMERLSPTGQNVVAGGALAATSYGAWRFGGAALGALGFGAGVGGRLGGAALAGGSAVAAGGASPAATLGANAAGGAAGGAAARAGGLRAAGRAAGRFALRAAPYALPATLLYEAATAPAERPGEKPSEYYARLRAGGEDRLGAALTTLGRAFGKVLSGAGPKSEAQERAEAGAERSRRFVTLAGGGFEETGSGYDRIQAAIGSVGGDVDATAPGWATALTDAVAKLAEEVRRASGGRLERPVGGGGA